MRLEDVLRALDAEQAKVATQAMEYPDGSTPFVYGKAVGTYAGIQIARRAIEKLHSEDEERRDRM